MEPTQDQTVTTAPDQTAQADPFSLDESKFISLSPEQRAALDPVLTEWKTKAKSELEKSSKTYEEKYKPHLEKAQALDDLVKDPRFVQWWKGLQVKATGANPAAAESISQAKPMDFATEQEWQDAIGSAYAGDPSKFKEIQTRMFAALATPVVQKMQESQDEIRTTLEMRDLFSAHPDAKELDAIGRNPQDKNDASLSLLEMALNWATENGKPLEQGYLLAKRWADSLRVGAKQEAMGMVQSKKESVTSGPTTHQGGETVVEVDDIDELMSKRMEYALSGEKAPRFVIRKNNVQPSSRWALKT